MGLGSIPSLLVENRGPGVAETGSPASSWVNLKQQLRSSIKNTPKNMSFVSHNNPSQNPNANHVHNPFPPYASSNNVPPPSPGVVGPSSAQFSYSGPHSIASQTYFQTNPDVDLYYSAAYAAHQVNQQLYAASSSTYGVVGTGNVTTALEVKKLKVLQGGAPAESVRTCTICDVVCNSDKVFASHLAGEKHKLKALGRPSNSALKPKVPTHVFTKKPVNSNPAITAAKKAAATMGFINFVQTSVCDVCKVDCTSQEVLNKHKQGKKHLKNLLKLQESISPKPVNANSSTSATDRVSKVDLEAKKLKVLSGGAAAHAIRVCTHCNVVCNSQEAYNSHIVGRKHVANVNKQGQAVPLV